MQVSKYARKHLSKYVGIQVCTYARLNYASMKTCRYASMQICYYLQKLFPFARCCTSRNFFQELPWFSPWHGKTKSTPSPRPKTGVWQNFHRIWLRKLKLQNHSQSLRFCCFSHDHLLSSLTIFWTSLSYFS